MFALIVVLAHQSDWLSVVLVLIPLACFALILSLANRRAERDGPVAVGENSYDHDDLDKGEAWH